MKNTKFQSSLFVLIAVSMLLSCSGKETKQPVNAEDQRLDAVITEYTEKMKHSDPYHASYFNVEEDLGKFGDYPAPEYFDREKKIVEDSKQKFSQIHLDALSRPELLAARLFQEDLDVSLREFELPGRYLELNQMGSRLHSYMDSSSKDLSGFPFDSVKHYEAYVQRSEGFPLYVDRQIALLREGLQKKIVLSCTVAGKVPHTYEEALQKEIEKNPFWRPVTFMPATFSSADQERLKQGFRKMISERILPGYQKFDQFYRTEYLPHCRSGFGLASLPDGQNWYRAEIRANTNLDLDPREVHETGLREVARINGELEKVKKELGHKESLQAFMHKMANDPKAYYQGQAQLFAAFEDVKARVAKRIPDYFRLQPKSDYKIVASSNPEDAAASYDGPTEMIPYGRFVVNTINPRAVPIADATTLSMHETIPGHHFQIALSFEMKDQLSEYQRKMFDSTAFVEGWALYSEFLGNEMGMYKDPLQRFGNLNDEMLRAVRLVVDTGIHAMGWSQEKAIAYAERYLASDPKDIENEINRYSVWPGQALAYKVGQMKIIELRRKAEKELGPKFDIKGFHEAVIGHGTVSLGVLESQVNDWVKSVQ